MSDLKVILDFCAEISWPLIVFIAMIIFRCSIRDFFISINKALQEVLKKNIHINKNSLTISSQNNNDKEKLLKFDTKDDKPIKIVSDLIEALRKNFEEVYPDKTGEEKEYILFKELADTRYVEQFNRILNQILGSQLDALFGLRLHGESALDVYYKTHIDRYNKLKSSEVPHLTFEQWVGFLTDYDLVKFTSSKGSITPIGDAFVNYIGNNPNKNL